MGRAQPRDLSGFSLPAWTLNQHDNAVVIATESLRATVHQPPVAGWHYRNNEGEWLPLMNDRPTSAYLLNAHGDGVAHYRAVMNETAWPRR
ncbi:hypothetical protein MJ589_04230 [Escherichia coli]|nr:hypothetical protein MJ589_04230 [Escherichia coli]